MIDITNTANGPPVPPNSLAVTPTAANENSTKGGHCNAYPIETAIAGPVDIFAYPPISLHNSIPNCSPIVEIIVPIKSDANSPCAIAANASMTYLLADISIFLRNKNLLIDSILNLSFVRYKTSTHQIL